MHWNLPNMILIAGNGRNVGKTTFATSLIRHFTESINVIGIKVTPHIHKISTDMKIIERTPDLVVAEEYGTHSKDSSLFLQAGASRVFLIMANDQFLARAFSFIADQLTHDLVIAESGGLNRYVRPGIFFFVRKSADRMIKEHYLDYDPVMVTNDNSHFDFNIDWLSYQNRQFTITKPES